MPDERPGLTGVEIETEPQGCEQGKQLAHHKVHLGEETHKGDCHNVSEFCTILNKSFFTTRVRTVPFFQQTDRQTVGAGNATWEDTLC